MREQGTLQVICEGKGRFAVSTYVLLNNNIGEFLNRDENDHIVQDIEEIDDKNDKNDKNIDEYKIRTLNNSIGSTRITIFLGGLQGNGLGVDLQPFNGFDKNDIVVYPNTNRGFDLKPFYVFDEKNIVVCLNVNPGYAIENNQNHIKKIEINSDG